MENFSKAIIDLMIKYFSSLNEKDKRRYAAIEAVKLGHGGIKIISSILNIDPKTIAKGIKELREQAIEKDDVFLEIVDNHKAGDPMNSEVNWTYLTENEVRNRLEEKGIQVSVYIVRMLFRLNKFVKRKMSKKGTIKYVENRNEQFENIERLKNEYSEQGYPIIVWIQRKKRIWERCIGTERYIQKNL